MTQSDIQIGVDDKAFDVSAIVATIRERARQKMEAGEYSDPRIAQAERHNLANLVNADEFFDYYIECMRETAQVDINDFEIKERRQRFNGLLVLFKRIVWNLLKYYTYRLWSQQNQVNAMLLSATEELNRKYQARIAKLEARIDALEKKS